MTMREVVRSAVEHRCPPYVPWSLGFTLDARAKLATHFGSVDLSGVLNNHIAWIGNGGHWEELPNGRARDPFGVVWDRSVDPDIGIVEGQVLPEPTLAGYEFPDPMEGLRELAHNVEAAEERFRMFAVGFSLYERAWTLRGMTDLMMDFYDHPQFVRQLMTEIADWTWCRFARP